MKYIDIKLGKRICQERTECLRMVGSPFSPWRHSAVITAQPKGRGANRGHSLPHVPVSWCPSPHRPECKALVSVRLSSAGDPPENVLSCLFVGPMLSYPLPSPPPLKNLSFKNGHRAVSSLALSISGHQIRH